jgi:hypothetical protein
MSRGLVSGKNKVTREEIVYRVSRWPDDVRGRVVRAIGFNLSIGEIRRARRESAESWTFRLENVLEEFPPEWHALLANGAGTSLRYDTRLRARTGELPSLLRRVQPAQGELFEEVVAGSASTNVALLYGQEIFDTFSEDTELMTMDTPSMSAFERGCGHYFARIWRRGIPHEVEMIERFRANFSSAPFEEGWRRGVEGRER